MYKPSTEHQRKICQESRNKARLRRYQLNMLEEEQSLGKTARMFRMIALICVGEIVFIVGGLIIWWAV